MPKVQLIGATGYGGLGILELLTAHPEFEITGLVARDIRSGRSVSDIYPHLKGRCELPIATIDEITVGDNADIVVFSTPDGVSQQYAKSLNDAGIRFIDYSGDFRFKSEADYGKYAGKHPSIRNDAHSVPELLPQAAYGVSELNMDSIGQADIVGNPGCFAIGIILGLAPLFDLDIVENNLALVDGLTGSSGAGKKPAPLQHFSHLNDNVVPYRVMNHQHTVEAELVLGGLNGTKPATVEFIPHLLGTTRGILNTMHVNLKRKSTRQNLLEIFDEFYSDHHFIRVLDTAPTLKDTLASNYCDISAFVSEDQSRAVIISSIDNLMKGQSGSALQNMNVMFGFDPALGLERGPLYP